MYVFLWMCFLLQTHTHLCNRRLQPPPYALDARISPSGTPKVIYVCEQIFLWFCSFSNEVCVGFWEEHQDPNTHIFSLILLSLTTK